MTSATPLDDACSVSRSTQGAAEISFFCDVSRMALLNHIPYSVVMAQSDDRISISRLGAWLNPWSGYSATITIRRPLPPASSMLRPASTASGCGATIIALQVGLMGADFGIG